MGTQGHHSIHRKRKKALGVLALMAIALGGWWIVFGYISTLALYAYTFPVFL